MHPAFRFSWTSAGVAIALLSLGHLPSAVAQNAPPSEEPIRRIINCMATATPNTVPWGHRYTYWLSGVAEFDEAGNMLPVSMDHSGDWILTITNSRFDSPETHNVLPVRSPITVPQFAFPAVSEEEWQQLQQRPTGTYVNLFSYPEASNGLYLAVRNTASNESPRQLFQVVHYLNRDFAMRSEATACFVGPRPMVIGGGDSQLGLER